jgi:xylulokinase
VTFLLGIDIGTSSTKTLLVSAAGKPVGSQTAEYKLHSPRPGWTEQEPADWWKAVVKTVRAVLRQARVKPAAVAGIGLSGQMHGSVFLDSSGKVLRRALLWNDQRTAEQCAEIESRAGGRAALIEMVSNPALTGFTAPKVLWLRRHEPQHYEKVARLLLPKDYIRFRLTGEFATEVSDASGTLLLDVKARNWCRPLLEKLEIPADWLPKVYESPEVSGTLHAAAAKELGLPAGVPVVGGGGDQAAGAVGAGIVRTGTVSCSVGTSGVVFAHSDVIQTDPAGRVHTFCHAVPGKWHVMGVMLSAGGSLQWFRNTLAAAESAEAKKTKKDVYELLVEKLAASAPVGCEGLVFLPYLTGERTPHADPHARGAWIGMTPRTDKAHLVRSLLEGVTFGLRDSLEIIRGMNIPVGEIRALSGGARSPFWRRMMADVFKAPVVCNKIEEGAAYGVALLAGVGTGVWKSVEEACDACVGTTRPVAPDAAASAVYDRRYPLWQQMYRSLRGDFARMAEPAGD